MPNLPADLPEDWTSNQKISPNGTEVGLSEQHGYNYLMKQVNDTQNEVNNIGTTIEAALEDVAKEASVQEVITSIGDTGDTGGSSTEGSLMAKLNEILAQLGISTTGSTVQEVLEELLTQPNIIKHKQNHTVYNRGEQTNLPLVGFTNFDKMILLGDNIAVVEFDISHVKIQQIVSGSYAYQTIQVVEFY